MTNKIHVLSADMINVIAAGEVIERPASVVKELVENSIDAGSTDIRIYVKQAGIEEIKVIDNGAGINPDELELAITAHTTSKVNRTGDIFRLKTMGFRGEALASIVQISRFELSSQTKNELGKTIIGAGGKVTERKTISKAVGTTVTVRELFFNTPVRLKYLKSISTELRHVTDIVQRLAMSQPQIKFSLYSNGKEILHTAGNGDFRQTVAGIYGVEFSQSLIEISKKDDDFSVNGFVSRPDNTRSNRRNINFSVNGRVVRSLELTRYLLDGYRTKLMVGRFPTAVIEIELDPHLVDVNIHPSKQELKISKIDQLGGLINQAVDQALGHLDLIPAADPNKMSFSDVIDPAVEMQKHFESLSHASVDYFTQNPQVAVGQVKENGEASELPNFEVEKPNQADFSNIPLFMPEDQQQMKKWDERYSNEKKVASFVDDKSDISTDKPKDSNLFTKAEEKSRFPTLEYVGQVQGTYLLANTKDGLYIIDQHAAQERINFEYYRQKLGEVNSDEQTLLVPLVLEYSQSDFSEIQGKKSVLADLGIHLTEFGGNSFLLNQYPAWIKANQVKSTIKEMIDFILNNHQITLENFRLKTAKMMSCKRAIKAHQFLSDSEARELIKNLAMCENPFNCPHGRPVLVQITNHDLDRMFKRLQDPHLHDLGLSVD
ncbi:DNA mismatch repair endonuclease MutL [Xylocopilactobacillus apicola]|uniref:DNA mismatch repair protein MutL n=1 Tax=Xylocopilactobacillus apicola TaxID=2932184 RepID=A0AAU9DS71_9LACO|nr:DNA mismatch repair endonuclease MutL [Xylocopilactobacillus apicola]BDR58849.1 DNA mismatch repair protein MutL [Xylocopilactobacillus apicola]